MNIHIHNNRRNTSKKIFSESRLCLKQPPNRPSGRFERMGQIGNEIVSSVKDLEMQKTLSLLAEIAGEGVFGIKDVVIAIPRNILDGLNNSLKSNHMSEYSVLSLLEQMGHFFREQPTIAQVLSSKLTSFDYKTLESLTSNQAWINAFEERRTQSQLYSTIQPLPTNPSDSFGPDTLLKSLDTKEQEAVYVSFVSELIPGKTLDHFNFSKDSATRKKEILDNDNSEDLNIAMKAMLGFPPNNFAALSALKPRRKDIAVHALQQHYQTNIPSNVGMRPGQLQNDYIQALSRLNLASNALIATDPDALMQKIPDSRFKGALQLGVIDRPMLEQIHPTLKLRDFETRQATKHIAENLNVLSGSTKLQLRQESESMFQLAKKLPLGVQLVLASALVVGFFKNKYIRRTTYVLGAAATFQYLALGDKDPTRTWSALAKKPLDILKNGNAAMVGQKLTPGKIEDVYQRAELYAKFLSPSHYRSMEKMGTGLGFIGDLPMSLLMRHFSIGNKFTGDFDLDMQGMDPAMKKMMKDLHWENGYRRFFAVEANRKAVAEAVSYQLYLRASRDQQNADYYKLVNDSYHQLPAGEDMDRLSTVPVEITYSHSGSKEKISPREAYVRMVGYGQDVFMNDDRSFGECAAVEVGSNLGFFNVASDPIDGTKRKTGSPQISTKTLAIGENDTDEDDPDSSLGSSPSPQVPSQPQQNLNPVPQSPSQSQAEVEPDSSVPKAAQTPSTQPQSANAPQGSSSEPSLAGSPRTADTDPSIPSSSRGSEAGSTSPRNSQPFDGRESIPQDARRQQGESTAPADADKNTKNPLETGNSQSPDTRESQTPNAGRGSERGSTAPTDARGFEGNPASPSSPRGQSGNAADSRNPRTSEAPSQSPNLSRRQEGDSAAPKDSNNKTNNPPDTGNPQSPDTREPQTPNAGSGSERAPTVPSDARGSDIDPSVPNTGRGQSGNPPESRNPQTDSNRPAEAGSPAAPDRGPANARKPNPTTKPPSSPAESRDTAGTITLEKRGAAIVAKRGTEELVIESKNNLVEIKNKNAMTRWRLILTSSDDFFENKVAETGGVLNIQSIESQGDTLRIKVEESSEASVVSKEQLSALFDNVLAKRSYDFSPPVKKGETKRTLQFRIEK